MKGFSTQFKVTAIYIIFGVLWIFFSDRLLEMMFSSPEAISQIQTVKGWLYVIVTALLLYILIKRDYKKIQKKEEEKQRIFDATLKAVYHILNNFLNGMQLFKMEAEKSSDFSENVLNLTERAMKEAQSQLKDLSAVTDISEEQIRQAVLPK